MSEKHRLRSRVAAHPDRQAGEAASARSLLAEGRDGEDLSRASCPGRGAARLCRSAEPGPTQRGWTPDQQRTARALRRIRGTSIDHHSSSLETSLAASRAYSAPSPINTGANTMNESTSERLVVTAFWQ